MFYNVRLGQPGSLAHFHVLDLSEGALHSKVLDPWHRGQPIATDQGLVVPEAATSIAIRRSEHSTTEILSDDRGPRAGTKAALIAVMKAGDDAKAEYIRGLPGCESEGGVPASVSLAVQICVAFPALAQAMAVRGHGRPSLVIRDEYDVQFLLAAVFRMFFADVRDEETMPSHGGKRARADFLLTEEEVFVETKMVKRRGFDKKLQTELADDFEQYRAHPKCRVVIALVYDPQKLLSRATQLEKDLTGPRGEGMSVRTVVAP